MRIKVVAFPVALLVLLMTLSDIFCRSGMAYLSHGDSLTGTRLLSLAERLNPYSMSVKMNQIESLFAFYRGEPNPIFLDEAVHIAKDLVSMYPGNAQAWGVYATANTMQLTHTSTPSALKQYTNIVEGLYVLDTAIEMDPLSVPLIENELFLLSAKRYDYPRFRRLGIIRTRYERKRLNMTCALDGKPWMEHR